MHLKSLRAQRWLSAWVALTYTLGWLLLFAHYVDERHAVCFEHGTTHHVADDADHDEHAAGLNAPEDAEHEHCSFLEVVRPAHTLPSAVTITLLAPCDAPTDQVAHYVADRTAPKDVWRYAPKTSPPESFC